MIETGMAGPARHAHQPRFHGRLRVVHAAPTPRADEESERADGRFEHIPGRAQAYRRRGAFKVSKISPSLTFAVLFWFATQPEHVAQTRVVFCWSQHCSRRVSTSCTSRFGAGLGWRRCDMFASVQVPVHERSQVSSPRTPR